ncbi:hypothetical protein F2P44_22010 [Massilia sp. CCM 8695]|uniref:Uncharacterized protein n=1 Tax=Massilia frigida TaxID=2609281 RepID=A0ABX0NG23_9BURK|nr:MULTISPECIES: hypothetical protein [Massilia]MDM5181027.1 hypothetical protein [Massilia sp. DJPM01]NHZ81929.1 hypothetical protein [Massilia frigida]
MTKPFHIARLKPQKKEQNSGSPAGASKMLSEERVTLRNSAPAGVGKTQATQPAASVVRSVSGREIARPKVLLYRTGESYASRSQNALKKTIVNTELPSDLVE